MNEIEKMLQVLNELGDTAGYGPFQGVTLVATGRARAVWAHKTEEFTLAELLHVTNQLPPVPEWQIKLGQALAHQAKGELAEARALELEVTDLLLAQAKEKLQPKINHES